MSDDEKVAVESSEKSGDKKSGCGAIIGLLFIILLFIGWISGGTIDAPRADVELRLAQGVAGRVFQFYPLIDGLDGEQASIGFTRAEAANLMGVNPGDPVSSESAKFAMVTAASAGPVVILLGPDEQINGAVAHAWPYVDGEYINWILDEIVGIAAAVDPELDQTEYRAWIDGNLGAFLSVESHDGGEYEVREDFGDLGSSITIIKDDVFTDRGFKPGVKLIVGLSP